jgi:hypothetical protein
MRWIIRKSILDSFLIEMNTTKPITIVKMGETAPLVKSDPLVSTAGKRKSIKTFPRGILKTAKSKFHLKATSDPSKPPPIKKYMKKHTIRLITDKGARQHRKTIKRRVSKMTDEKVKKMVATAGLLKNPTTPVSVMREMLEGGMIAGFISSE